MYVEDLLLPFDRFLVNQTNYFKLRELRIPLATTTIVITIWLHKSNHVCIKRLPKALLIKSSFTTNHHCVSEMFSKQRVARCRRGADPCLDLQR